MKVAVSTAALVKTLPACALALALCVVAGQARAIEPTLTGLRAPVAIQATPQGLLVSNWSGDTVERIAADGTRAVFCKGVAQPAGIAASADGTVYVASYSDNVLYRVGPDGVPTVVIRNLATPAGLAFARDGRLLVCNRASGEVLAVDPASGRREVVAGSLTLPVGVVEMPDGRLVVSQYGGRVTCLSPGGRPREIGQSFVRPGVGILADGPDAVLVVDNGASVVRRVGLDGTSRVVVEGLADGAVALGRADDGDLLIGAWGGGNLYRVPWPGK